MYAEVDMLDVLMVADFTDGNMQCFCFLKNFVLMTSNSD